MKTVKTLALFILTISLVSCNTQGTGNKSIETEIDSVSYSIGLDIAGKLNKTFKDVNVDLLAEGIKNGIDSTDFKIENKEAIKIVRAYFQKKSQEKYKNSKAAAIKKAEKEYAMVKVAGEEFLKSNKSKKGVKTTKSGLQYIVLKKGNGAKPTNYSKVKLHFHGTLIDGTVFDSSVDRKRPYETVVNRVIKGWIEGLKLMNVGAKYKFFVPQELAYGATPKAGVIKPFMPLIFEVELLEILK